MPEERLIPAVQSVAEFIIQVNGIEIPRSIPKLSVNVTKVVNKLSSAQIVLQDGEALSGRFPLSEGDLFLPGNSILIMAGEPNNPTAIFTGIVIKQSLKIRPHSAPQLVITCRHKAVTTTLVRKSACYHNSTDDEIITGILHANGFAQDMLDIESCSLMHSELVQYNCTDWDFIINRAEVMGKMVLTNSEKIAIKAPTVAGEPSLSLLHGATILELDAELDPRNLVAGVTSTAWDPAHQQTISAVADTPTRIEEIGNITAFSGAALMGNPEIELLHPGALPPEELKYWADAHMQKSWLSKIRGRVKFDGIAALQPGDIIDLAGLGGRFNGKALVTGVRQDYDMAGWKTQAQFGDTPDWFAPATITVPKAGGLLPGSTGLHTGIVTDNEDPSGEYRIRVRLPYINDSDDGIWARMALADAGSNRGLFFRPEIGDEVIIGFLYDDPRQPLVLGMLHSGALASPLQPSNNNHQKGYTSREGIQLIFDDQKKSVVVETPAGNKITISDQTKEIVLQDQNSNSITMNPTGITINAAKKLEITAGTQLVIGGLQVAINGDSGIEIKGGTNTKIESTGALDLKGSIVKIN